MEEDKVLYGAEVLYRCGGGIWGKFSSDLLGFSLGDR